MRINKRVKNIRTLLTGLKSHKRTLTVGAAVIAGGLCIAYGFSRVEESMKTYVPVTNPEKPVIVLDAGHGRYVLNRVAGAIWFLTTSPIYIIMKKHSLFYSFFSHIYRSFTFSM